MRFTGDGVEMVRPYGVYELPDGKKVVALVTTDYAVFFFPEVKGGAIYKVDMDNGLLAKFKFIVWRPEDEGASFGWEQTQIYVDELQEVKSESTFNRGKPWHWRARGRLGRG